jgi:broad specificity phosphatase PhoE
VKLVLLRHGLSLANQRGVVTGTPDDPLSPEGIVQVQRTRELLTSIGFHPQRCYVSHWQRARESAALVAPGLPFHTDPRIGETYAADVAQWPLTRFLAEYPDFYSDPRRAYPGGESHEQLNARVLEWLDDTRRQCNDQGVVLAVTHAGPIACLLQHALGISMERFPALMARNASLNVIEYPTAASHGKVLAFSQTPADALAELFGRSR